MVTVKIGSDTLRGVLYHVHQPSSASSSVITATPEPSNEPSLAVTRARRRRRRGWRHRDPAHPKPNRSAYNFFFAEKHSKLKALHPHREREFSKMIGESWNKLTEEERTVSLACVLHCLNNHHFSVQFRYHSFFINRFIRILD